MEINEKKNQKLIKKVEEGGRVGRCEKQTKKQGKKRRAKDED